MKKDFHIKVKKIHIKVKTSATFLFYQCIRMGEGKMENS